MKLLVCESCDAEFSIKHNMDKRLYKIEHCPFCGEQLNEEMEDEVEEFYDEGYDERQRIYDNTTREKKWCCDKTKFTT